MGTQHSSGAKLQEEQQATMVTENSAFNVSTVASLVSFLSLQSKDRDAVITPFEILQRKLNAATNAMLATDGKGNIW